MTVTASKVCDTCRFWSDMLARSVAGEGLTAMCLATDGPHSTKYTAARHGCTRWKAGHLGAIDEPPRFGAQYSHERG